MDVYLNFPQGAFVLNVDGEYTYDYEASPFAATGYTHESVGAFAGASSGIQKNVSDFIVVDGNRASSDNHYLSIADKLLGTSSVYIIRPANRAVYTTQYHYMKTGEGWIKR